MADENLFARTKKLLDSLPEMEYRNSLRGFLSPSKRTLLPGSTDNVDRGSALDLIQQLGTLNSYHDYLLENYSRYFSTDSDAAPTLVQFVNRTLEIDKILASEFTTTKFLVCAPAGYGKSFLLEELQKRYQKDSSRKWDCTRVVINTNVDLESAMRMLCSRIGQDLDIQIDLENEKPQWGKEVGRGLNRKHLQTSPNMQPENMLPGGLCILIDLEEEPNQIVLKTLLEEFIPQLLERLSIHKPYKEDDFFFRLVLAGRYLTKIPNLTPSSDYINIHLTPFTITTLRRSAANCFRHVSNTDELAAHTLFLGAGHPGSMAHTFNLFAQDPGPINEFVENYQPQILDETVSYAEKAISKLNEIAPDFKDLLPLLAAFRYLSDNILNDFLEQHTLPEIIDGEDFADKLRWTYLYESDYPLIRDGITRRILAVYYFRESPEQFVNHCELAQQLCSKRILDLYEPRREKWVVEFMFQSLQMYMCDEPNNKKNREEHRIHFFEEVVPSLAKLIDQRAIIAGSVPGSPIWIQDWRFALNEIESEEQWEFRFLLKYILRGDAYDDGTFEQLKSTLSDLGS